MTQTMKVEDRRSRTKSELRQLRRQGKVPGVVYGKGIGAARAIAVEEKELLALLRSNPNALLELDVPSVGTQPVMLTDVQRDPLSRHVLHIDFHQVDMNEAVRTHVRVELVGEAPGDREGGIVQVMQHELEIECLPSRIPDVLQVDVSSLQIGENILAGDLPLPAGVEMRSDAELVVVTILAPQKELTEAEAEDAEVREQESEARAKEANAEEVARKP